MIFHFMNDIPIISNFFLEGRTYVSNKKKNDILKQELVCYFCKKKIGQKFLEADDQMLLKHLFFNESSLKELKNLDSDCFLESKYNFSKKRKDQNYRYNQNLNLKRAIRKSVVRRESIKKKLESESKSEQRKNILIKKLENPIVPFLGNMILTKTKEIAKGNNNLEASEAQKIELKKSKNETKKNQNINLNQKKINSSKNKKVDNFSVSSCDEIFGIKKSDFDQLESIEKLNEMCLIANKLQHVNKCHLDRLESLENSQKIKNILIIKIEESKHRIKKLIKELRLDQKSVLEI